MDYSMFIVLGCLMLAIGIFYVVNWAKKKGYVKQEDLELVGSIMGLGISILSEAKFKDDEEFKRISYLVNASFVYCTKVYAEGDTETLKKDIIEYTKELCSKQNIELNPNRELIVTTLADMMVKK